MGPPPGMGGAPAHMMDHMMDMGMPRPYDDGPPSQAGYQGGPGGGAYGPAANMGGAPGMGPPAGLGPPPALGAIGGMGGMGGPGAQGANLGPPGMGAAPPPQTQNILANLTPQQREQFQQLINSTPEQVGAAQSTRAARVTQSARVSSCLLKANVGVSSSLISRTFAFQSLSIPA